MLNRATSKKLAIVKKCGAMAEKTAISRINTMGSIHRPLRAQPCTPVTRGKMERVSFDRVASIDHARVACSIDSDWAVRPRIASMTTAVRMMAP